MKDMSGSQYTSSQAKKAIEEASQRWREFSKPLRELDKGAHPGANLLSFVRDRLDASHEWLLQHGLDVSDLRNPQIVPVPVAQHPKTSAEAREWEAGIELAINSTVMHFAVAGAGTYGISSAVGTEALADALMPYAEGSGKLLREDLAAELSQSNLLVLALACSIWLLEPTGESKSSRDEMDAACLKRMLYALETSVLSRNVVNSRRGELPEKDRAAASNALAGWSLSNVSLRGKAGGSLRRALGTDPEETQYARFLKELPGATQIALEDWSKAGEPLRPAGDGYKSLVRRVAGLLERSGSEAATKPNKVTDLDLSRRDYGGGDDLLEEFEAEETLRADLGRLKDWVEKASLSEQERQVYELDMQTDYNATVAAQQLHIPEGQVRAVRKRYHDKLRKAAGL